MTTLAAIKRVSNSISRKALSLTTHDAIAGCSDPEIDPISPRWLNSLEALRPITRKNCLQAFKAQ